MNLVKASAITLLFWCFHSVGCEFEQARAFDFWLGEWQVSTPNGKVAGENSITLDLNACVLREHYKTATGYEGRSLNIFDRQTGMWHQTWVDNQGLLLRLKGNRKDNTMVLSGSGKGQDGGEVNHRITWTANQDGTVRQHWQIRPANTEAWQTAFDGLYTAKAQGDH